MDKVGGVLDRLVERWNLKRNLREQGVFAAWDSCVGETVAAHAQPDSIHQGRLLVTVSDPAWNHQLQFLKDDIKKKLNSILGRAVVTELRFRIGEINPKAKPSPPAAKAKPILLEAGVLQAIEEAVAVIKDEELREVVRRYLMAAAKPGKEKK